MASTDQSHITIIAAALRQLYDPPARQPDEYQLLAGGMSGSFVYEVRLGDMRAVLKVTLPTSPHDALAQARREAWFYERLAPRVPLRVPRPLALDVDEARGIAILLNAYQPSPPAPCWIDRHYVEIASQLGRLHGSFWGKTAGLAAFQWLRPEPRQAMPERCRRASMTWRVMGEREALRDGVIPRRLQTVQRLLERLSALGQPQPIMPPTLCHGDCHTGNILHGSTGEWMWADWQAVHIGSGAEDISFFCQRTLAAGGTLPREAMVDAYRAAIAAEVEDAPAAERIERALAWAELTSWLLDWPPFLTNAPAHLLGHVLDRIDSVVDRLEINVGT
jgi:aminoglycoside phosphotransferase (APT) family kinase protein